MALAQYEKNIRDKPDDSYRQQRESYNNKLFAARVLHQYLNNSSGDVVKLNTAQAKTMITILTEYISYTSREQNEILNNYYKQKYDKRIEDERVSREGNADLHADQQ